MAGPSLRQAPHSIDQTQRCEGMLVIFRQWFRFDCAAILDKNNKNSEATYLLHPDIAVVCFRSSLKSAGACSSNPNGMSGNRPGAQMSPFAASHVMRDLPLMS